MNYRKFYKVRQGMLPRLSGVGKGTVLAVLVSMFFLIVFLVWLFFAALGWFYKKLPVSGETGMQSINSFLQHGSQLLDQNILPVTEWQNQIDHFSALARGEVATITGVDPAAVVGSLSKIAEGLSAEKIPGLPTVDVPGDDVVPVQRYPGLIRYSFLAEQGSTTVHYLGKADFDKVLEYYVQGFYQRGFQQELLSATATAETHRFIRRSSTTLETLTLTVQRQAEGLVKLSLQKSL